MLVAQTTGPVEQQESTKQQANEDFQVLVRLLLKYLERKDGLLHARATSIIKDCAERKLRQGHGYEFGDTAPMERRLKELVGNHHWKSVCDYLDFYIAEDCIAEEKRRDASSIPASKRKYLEDLVRLRLLLVLLGLVIQQHLRLRPSSNDDC